MAGLWWRYVSIRLLSEAGSCRCCRRSSARPDIQPEPAMRRRQVLREIVTLERMHRAFAGGLMEYGMAKAVKKKAATSTPAAASAAAETPSLVSV